MSWSAMGAAGLLHDPRRYRACVVSISFRSSGWPSTSLKTDADIYASPPKLFPPTSNGRTTAKQSSTIRRC